jgi:hypothetical protein
MTRPRYFSPAASFLGAACEQHLAQSKPVPHYSRLIPESVFSICEENHERPRTVKRDIWAVERDIAKGLQKPQPVLPQPQAGQPHQNPACL